MKANSHDFLKLGKERLGREKMKRVEAKQGKAYSDSSELEDREGMDRTSGRHFTHGYHLVKGKQGHAMEDYVVAQRKKIDGSEPDFWTDPESAIKNSNRETDSEILEEVVGARGEVQQQKGVAKQLSVDHEPKKERETIESKGGFVTEAPGVLGADKKFRTKMEENGKNQDASRLLPLSVMSNQEAVDAIRDMDDAQAAAELLVEEALSRKSYDDISCILVRFH
ncbi:putative protein phosphatase 2C 58 [Cinnamomum micranthum f. kanehirae]|uniref:Uncharacterized protein n=1 Tax=Cinnamomum micranthum f. kanehirae TaxID=337451 RepID=A0A3S3PE70_9MAGN|nr:putative protein phosphatase 2C 58 [Cinnamomum micranthum f. kanehirae]